MRESTQRSTCQVHFGLRCYPIAFYESPNWDIACNSNCRVSCNLLSAANRGNNGDFSRRFADTPIYLSLSWMPCGSVVGGEVWNFTKPLQTLKTCRCRWLPPTTRHTARPKSADRPLLLLISPGGSPRPQHYLLRFGSVRLGLQLLFHILMPVSW